jgi:hypothetical protein
MKTNTFIYLLIFYGINTFQAVAQVHWDTQGNATNPGDFLGTTNAQPLELRTTQSEHINLFTNSIHRIKLNPDVAYAVDGYAGDRNGYLLLGNSQGGFSDSIFTNANEGAYSLLHLNGPHGTLQPAGYRPWMQTGSHLQTTAT